MDDEPQPDAPPGTEPAAGDPDGAPGGAVEGAVVGEGDVHAPDHLGRVVADGTRELGGVDAPAEQWEAFGVRDDTVEGWRAIGFGPFEAALAQGDGYGPESARHLAKKLRDVAGSWRQVGLASEEGLRWPRAGFQARDAARFQDQGVPLDQALSFGGGHRLVG